MAVCIVPRGENVLASYPGWPGYEAKHVYTWHWYVEVTCAALWAQTMPNVYLFRASHIHA